MPPFPSFGNLSPHFFFRPHSFSFRRIRSSAALVAALPSLAQVSPKLNAQSPRRRSLGRSRVVLTQIKTERGDFLLGRATALCLNLTHSASSSSLPPSLAALLLNSPPSLLDRRRRCNCFTVKTSLRGERSPRRGGVARAVAVAAVQQKGGARGPPRGT